MRDPKLAHILVLLISQYVWCTKLKKHKTSVHLIKVHQIKIF